MNRFLRSVLANFKTPIVRAKRPIVRRTQLRIETLEGRDLMSSAPLAAVAPVVPAMTAAVSRTYATVYDHTTLVRPMTTQQYTWMYTHDYLVPRLPGYFRIDNEIVYVTEYNTPGTAGYPSDPNFTTYVVTRGNYGTTPATHAAGAIVSWISHEELVALSSHPPTGPSPVAPAPSPVAPVLSPLATKYQQLGGAAGFLGPAVGRETDLPAIPGVRGAGKYQDFRNGSIYWSAGTGAHEVHGAIRSLWVGQGAERSFLAYPTTDELTAPDGRGRYSLFQGGAIYWTPQTGAHEVHGAIRSLWAYYGAERSVLGYPTSNEYTSNGGRRSDFQHGFIFWTPQTGAIAYRF